MRTLNIITLICLIILPVVVRAQQSEIIRTYVKTYKNIAIAEEQRSGVPAAIKLAQGIHETLAGTSELVKKSNNHFGIKCKSNWTGESVSHTDDAPNECFRKYADPADSYRDHSDFLRSNKRYASLFALDPLDYEGWANGLRKAGYATNPKYPQIIIRLIEDYDLQDYTLIALGKEPVHAQEETAAVLPGTQKERGGSNTDQPAAAADDRGSTDPAGPSEPTPSYPAGEFRINETRVVYVGEGVPLLSVAEQYHIPLARLFEFNELPETETLARPQLMYLQRKRKTGSNSFHVVKAGETVSDIAQLEGIRLESLLELNLLDNYMQPATGERLSLRSKASSAPRLSETPVTRQQPSRD